MQVGCVRCSNEYLRYYPQYFFIVTCLHWNKYNYLFKKFQAFNCNKPRRHFKGQEYLGSKVGQAIDDISCKCYFTRNIKHWHAQNDIQIPGFSGYCHESCSIYISYKSYLHCPSCPKFVHALASKFKHFNQHQASHASYLIINSQCI